MKQSPIAPIALSLLLAGSVTACKTDPDPATDGGEADTGEVVDTGMEDTGEVDTGIVANCELPGPELNVGQAPPRRGDMAFAFDTECERVIMFFGDKAEPANCGPVASQFLDDGWMFDPVRGTWAQIEVQGGNAPQQRARSVGTWDSVGNRMILFGGRYRSGTSGPYTYFNDIWAFNPTARTWERLAAQGTGGAPIGRQNTSMVFDPTNNRVLIYGGGQVAADFQSYLVDDETWAFNLDDNTWEQIVTTGPKPEARLFHVAGFDTMRGRMFIFGGGGEMAFTDPTFFRDLWALDVDAGTWSEMPFSAADYPSGRIKGEMDYDARNDRIVLFAGHDDQRLGNDNDVWYFDPSLNWTRQSLGDVWNAPGNGVCDFPADFATVDLSTPERRESHLFVIHDGKAYMYGGRTDCGLSNDTWILDTTTGVWTEISESLNGMTCFRSGRTDCEEPNARKCG